MSAFRPTDEQQAALDLFLQGDSLVVDALAGVGKTSLMCLLAASTRRSGKYVVFNKAAQLDVAGRLPDRCPAVTSHSMAFQAIGRRYSHRLNSSRMKSAEIAKALGIRPLTIRYGGETKVLAPGFMASHVMRAIETFCNSADEVPALTHFTYVDGIDLPDATGKRTWTNNFTMREHLASALRIAWADLQRVDGGLRYNHSAYMKIWSLSRPLLPLDYVLLDEAQDTAPVLASVIEGQMGHAQVVMVGDANQQVYSWRGAVDAMENFSAEHRRALTRTWRFGPAIATEANNILAMLDSPLRLVASPDIVSTVGELPDGVEPDAVLCRTNASAIETVLNTQRRGHPVHLVGGGKQVASFARGALDLQAGKWTSHAELTCFDSWGAVQDYVANDPSGSELALMVRLVDDFGADVILNAVSGTTPEGPGVLTVGTGHATKGREWDTVKIHGDFADVDPSDDELRLRYVGFTRARLHLDKSVFDLKAQEARR